MGRTKRSMPASVKRQVYWKLEVEFDRMRENPYPTVEQRKVIAKNLGISFDKVSNFFINQRRIVWRPSLQFSSSSSAVMKQEPLLLPLKKRMSARLIVDRSESRNNHRHHRQQDEKGEEPKLKEIIEPTVHDDDN